MSSIIKGQRIRSQSKLELEHTNIYAKKALQDKDESHHVDIKEQEKKINNRIEKAKHKAERIISEAIEEGKQKAEAIINEGMAKLETDSFAALEKAKEEGYFAGYEKGQLDAQSLIEEGKQIVVDANKEKQEILDQIEPEIIEMVIGICGKLIDEEVSFNQDTILILIRKALNKFSSDVSEVTIKVCPDEYDYVLENQDTIAANIVNIEELRIRKDPNLTKGVCIIDTPFGSVECNVNEAFSELSKQMRLISSKK